MADDVKITFHIALAKQSTQLKKYVQDIKTDIANLNNTVTSTGRKVAASTNTMIQNGKKHKKQITDTTTAIHEQQKAWDTMHTKWMQQTANRNRALKSYQTQLVNASTHPQITSGGGLFGPYQNVRRSIRQGPASDLASARRQGRYQAMDDVMRNVSLMQRKSRVLPTPFNIDRTSLNANLKNMAKQDAEAIKRLSNSVSDGFSKAQREGKQFYQSMVQTAGGVNKLNEAFQKTNLAAKVFNNWLSTVKGAINYAIFLALTAALGALTYEFLKFDAALREAAGLSPQVSKNFDNVRIAIEEMTRKVPKTASDLAGGLRDIVSSTNLAIKDQLRLLEVSSMLAVGGFVPTATATKALVTVMNSYSLGVDAAGAISDVLFQTMNTGIVTVSELAEELGKVTPIASAAGISFLDVSAAMAVMTKNGNAAARSSTTLARIINDIIAPTAQGQRFLSAMLAGTTYQLNAQTLQAKGLRGAFESINIAVANYIAKTKGIAEPIRDLDAALALIDQNRALGVEGLSKIFTDKENLKGFTEFIGTEGMKQFLDSQQQMQAATGATKRAFDEANKAYSNAGKSFVADISTGFSDFAASVAPAVVAVLSMVGKLLGFILKLLAVLANNLVLIIPLMIGLSMAIFGVQSTLLGATLMAQAFWTALFAPVTIVIGAFLALAALFTVLSGKQLTLAEVMATAWNMVVDKIKLVIMVIYGIIWVLGAVAAGAWSTASMIIDFFKDASENMKNAMHLAALQIGNFFIDLWNSLKEGLANVVNFFTNRLQDFLDKIQKFLPEEWQINIRTNFDWGHTKRLEIPPEVTGRLSRSWMERFNENMKRLGIKTIPEMWEELGRLLPSQTAESIRSMFSFTADAGFEFDSDLSKLTQTPPALQTAYELQLQNVEFARDIISQIDSSFQNVADSFKTSAEAMIKLGKSANEVSEILLLIQQAQLAKMVVDTIMDIQKMAEGLATKFSYAGSVAFGLTGILEKVQLAYLGASQAFLEKLLAFGSPEELAQIFAKQNYISQNVNQSVVIAPYIQIDGNQNQEEILKVIDSALTEWAAQNGFTTGR